MPTATTELHDLMDKYFGDPISDCGPMKYLEEEGYQLTRDWQWVAPEGVDSYGTMSQKAYECLTFLVQEWDFGGLK